jgi:integrase
VRTAAAGDEVKTAGKAELAERIKAFQFRDIRPKAASEITSLEDASKLLGHTDKQITQKVYRWVGEIVKPTR